MANKKRKKVKTKEKLIGDERIIDLLERLGVFMLYINTPLGQNEVAKAIGIDVHRVSDLVKGIKKTNKQS